MPLFEHSSGSPAVRRRRLPQPVALHQHVAVLVCSSQSDIAKHRAPSGYTCAAHSATAATTGSCFATLLASITNLSRIPVGQQA